MQLYHGLPIITNKITEEEQQGIPHHLLGCIGLHEQTWVVGTFVKKALSIIDEIRSRGRLPILVGGTHYYTQSLLFRDRLAEENEDDGAKPYIEDTSERWPVLGEPTDVLLEELKKVDPAMADRWHPNDRRKIRRSLEIYLQTGRKASEIYAEQRAAKKKSLFMHSEDDTALGQAAMRFPTLLFWIHADAEVLRERLDTRVDEMMENGLLGEVQTMRSFSHAEAVSGRLVDETRGIWVSIGYKEFKTYADALHAGDMIDNQVQGMKLEALERTKIATRQYAKRQLRWIRIKLLNELAQANAIHDFYLLDGTDISQIEEGVVMPALELAKQFLSATKMPDPTSLSAAAATMLAPKRDYDLSAAPEKWTKQHCEVCGITCVTQEQWNMHLKSKSHRKLTSKDKDAKENRRSYSQPKSASQQQPADLIPP